MALKLSLTARGLILVAIPLVFELGSVAVLVKLQSQAEAEAREAYKAKEIADRVNNLTKDIFSVFEVVSQSTKGRWFEEGYLESTYQVPIKKLTSEYQELEKLTANDPRLHQAIEKSFDALKEVKEILDFAAQKIREKDFKDFFLHNRSYNDRLKELFRLMISEELNFVEKHEKEIAGRSPIQQARLREEIVRISLIAVFGNVVFSIVLAVFIVRSITSRINLLSDNARRLASGKPLNRPLDGIDELARLDRSFRHMAGALDEMNRKERAIVDNALDTICAIDRDGRFVAVNPACFALFGLEPDEMLGQRMIEFVDDTDREALTEWFNRIKQDQGQNSKELKVKSGRDRGQDASSQRTRDTIWTAQWSNAEQTLYCVIHDISEQKELERLRQELVAMLTHDLRSPLNTIQGLFDLLEAGRLGSLNERGQTLLKVANRNSQRMMALINDMLDVEKAKAGLLDLDIKPIRVLDIFENVQGNLDDWLKESVQTSIQLDVVPPDLRVDGDFDKLSRVLFNLVSNAVKFSPPNSKIWLRAMVSPHDQREVMIGVEDFGPGIPKEMQQIIFERFAQVKSLENRDRGGSGLGLAICRAFVDLQGGRIWVESPTNAANQGSRFCFTIARAYP